MSKPIEESQPDIAAIFEQMEKKAKEINPGLMTQIELFSSNRVAMESYQNYMNILNQTPVATVSNQVTATH